MKYYLVQSALLTGAAHLHIPHLHWSPLLSLHSPGLLLSPGQWHSLHLDCGASWYQLRVFTVHHLALTVLNLQGKYKTLLMLSIN